MKKLFSVLCIVGLSFLLAFMPQNSVYAMETYDPSRFKEVDNSEWEIDPAKAEWFDQTVTLYLLFQSYSNKSNVWYEFECFSNLVEGETGVHRWNDDTLNATFSLDATPIRKEVVAEFGYDKVYSYTFGILPGDYCFAPAGGNGSVEYGGDVLLTLTDSMVLPLPGYGYYEEDIYDKMFDDWSNLEHYDILTIEPGKNYCIYAIYGAPYWCVESESVKGYIEWAKGHREEFENSDARIAEIRVKEEPIVEEEPTVQESVKYESTIPVAKPSLKSKLGWVGPAGVIGVLGAAVLIFIKRRK